MSSKAIWTAGIIVFAGTASVLFGMLWWIEHIKYSGTSADSAKVIASVVALVGTLFTAVVSFIGLFLKHSMERHNSKMLRLESDRNFELKVEAEQRLNLENERNLALKKDAEERLRLETAIKAVELFRSASGAVSSSESAGALFALLSLGQHGFALRLLQNLWRKGGIDTPSAVWAINKALQSGSEESQRLGAKILLENATRLPDETGGIYWPSLLSESWQLEIFHTARANIAEARLRALMSKSIDSWDEGEIHHTLVLLASMQNTEPKPYLRHLATIALEQVLTAYVNWPDDMKIIAPSGQWSIIDIRTETEVFRIKGFEFESNMAVKLASDLSKWVQPLAVPAVYGQSIEDIP
jgi:hypothetical protein